MQSPRLSVTQTICLHFYFLVSRPGMGWRKFPSISFCLPVVALNVYRASDVWDNKRKSSCLVLQLQSAEYLEGWPAALNEDERSVSVNGNEETHFRDLNLMHFTSISNVHYSCATNSSTLDVGIIASVCGLPNSPS